MITTCYLFSEPMVEQRIVKSSEEIQKEREEKETKLREALEPKSLEDIRRERALKKSQPGLFLYIF